MKKIIELIKNYWNVWGSAIISFIVGWLMDFNKVSMDKTTSFLSMFLVMFALLTVIKVNYGKKRKKTIIEKGITSQKQLKAMEKAINPMKEGEELYEALLQTKKIFMERKRIKIMNWIKENKGSILTIIVGVLSVVSTLCSYLIETWNIVLNVNGFPLVAVIGGCATTITGVLTMPITSTSKGIAQNTATAKYKETKKENASIIKKYEEQIERFTNKFNEVKNNFEDLQICKDCGLSYDVAKYNQLNNDIKTLTDTIERLKVKKEEL